MKQTFHASRASICPICFKLIQADLVEQEQGLVMEKFCPDHGHFKTRIAGDYRWHAELQDYAAVSVSPQTRQTKVNRGCPYDCGECEAHRQKSAFFLFELTDRCNLSCPICLGNPGRKNRQITSKEMVYMIETVISYAGQAPIVTLGGGEPTIHPDFFDLVDIAKSSGIEDIWVYTNGLKLSKDAAFARRMVEENLYVVLQWDGFDDAVYKTLRGRALLDEKQRALSNLKSNGARIGICPTLVAGVNDGQIGRLYDFFIKDPQIIMLDIATMAFVGKGREFNSGSAIRITAQDVLTGLEEQTDGAIRASDFSPISFSNPECLQIAYLFALPDGGFIPLKRFLDINDYYALVKNTPLLVLNAEKESVFRDVINRLWADGKEDEDTKKGLTSIKHILKSLFPEQPLSSVEFNLRSRDLVKTILVHAYMDGLNFDVGRAKMCISRTVQPDGKLIPTCAYNVIHRHKEEVE